MSIKSNMLKTRIVENIPITLEGAQLGILNVERLFKDSQNVSIPTRFAFLEIALEEVAKVWGIILNFENNLFDQNTEYINVFMKNAHINRNKYTKKMDELKNVIINCCDKKDISSLLMPFNKETFSNHKEKIKFLFRFIKYIRNIELPLIRSSSDRVKLTREILGEYISKSKLSNMKEIDKIIDNILDVNDSQLTYIIDLKESGLYLDVQKGVYISPSAKNFEIETLEDLLILLLGMAKNELVLIIKVINNESIKNPNKIKKANNGTYT
ncbi:hypothetical protein [Acidiplasma aeolicum]|uniref:Uncharacterized protein n=2 Tax=Acidiplasma aeolicum TaxID=507754 RepID=A0A0Q0RIM3_9ARCH|nr:hypothetical protein [Acidiplasma aeolicum]KQB35282.1 hypothetical protein AOG54_09120 [Acidiplasma aeolicum]